MPTKADNNSSAAGRDMSNHTITNVYVNLPPVGSVVQNSPQVLPGTARKRLNDRVEEVAKICKEHPADIWSELHDCAHVNKAAEIPDTYLDALNKVLDLKATNAKLQAYVNELEKVNATLHANAVELEVAKATLRANALTDIEDELLMRYRFCCDEAKRALITNAALFSKIPKEK